MLRPGSLHGREHWRGYLFVGAVGLALPFVLIAEALTVIDASTAAILNALSPLFASVVAAVWIRDPITPAKAAGIALCLAGTAILVGWTDESVDLQTHFERNPEGAFQIMGWVKTEDSQAECPDEGIPCLGQLDQLEATRASGRSSGRNITPLPFCRRWRASLADRWNCPVRPCAVGSSGRTMD